MATSLGSAHSSSDSSSVSDSEDHSPRADDHLPEGALPNTAADDAQMFTGEGSTVNTGASVQGVAHASGEAAGDELASEAASISEATSTAPAAVSGANPQTGKVRKLKSPSKSSWSKTATTETRKSSATGVVKSTSRGCSESGSKIGNVSSTQKQAAGTTAKNKLVLKSTSRPGTKSAPATAPPTSKKQVTSSQAKSGISSGGHSQTSTANSAHTSTTSASAAPKQTGVSRSTSIKGTGSGTSSFRGPGAGAGGQTASTSQPKRASGTATSTDKDGGARRQSKTSLSRTLGSRTPATTQSGQSQPQPSTGAIPKTVSTSKTSVDRKNVQTASPGGVSSRKTNVKSCASEASPSGSGNKTKVTFGSSKKDDKLACSGSKDVGPGHYKKRLSYNAPSVKATKPMMKKSKEAPAAVGGRPGEDESGSVRQGAQSVDARRVGNSGIPVPKVLDSTSRGSATSVGSTSTDDIADSGESGLRAAERAEILHQSSRFGATGELTAAVGAGDLGSSEQNEDAASSRVSNDIPGDDSVTTLSEQLVGLEMKDSTSEVSSGNALPSIGDEESSIKRPTESGLSFRTTLSSLHRHSADDTAKIKPYPIPQRQGLLKHGLSLSVDQLRRGEEGGRGGGGSMSAEASAIPSPVFDQSESVKESPSVSLETDNFVAIAGTARAESVQATQACEFPLAVDASEASSEATVGADSQETKTEQTPRKRVNLMDFLVKDCFSPSDPNSLSFQKAQISGETKLDKAMMSLLANSYRNLLKKRQMKAAEKMLENASTQSCSSSNFPSSVLSQADSREISRSPTPQPTEARRNIEVEEDDHTEPPESATESIEEVSDVAEGGASVAEGGASVAEGGASVAEGGASVAEGGARRDCSSRSTTTSSDSASRDELSRISAGSATYDLLYNFQELEVSDALEAGEFKDLYLTQHEMVCEALALLRCDKDNQELVNDALRVLGNYVETDFCYFVLKYATPEEIQLIKDTATPHQAQVLEDKELVQQCVSHDEGLIWA